MTKNQNTKNSDAAHKESEEVKAMAQNLLVAMDKAFHILGLSSNHKNLTSEKTILSCGEHPMFFEYSWTGVDIDIYREVSVSYTLAAHVSICIKNREKTPNRVRVTWPSGGGNVLVAVAQATYQLELAQKALRAEMILAEVFASIYSHKAENFTQLVFEELARGATAAFANFKYTLAKERTAQELA